MDNASLEQSCLINDFVLESVELQVNPSKWDMLHHTKPDKFHCYLYRPYQQLRAMGYRLAGKQCTYERHTLAVTPLGPTTRGQQLMGLLFPVAVFCLVLILELALAGYLSWRFYATMPWLLIPLAIVAAIPLSPYFYQALFDTWRAYRLWKS